MKIETRTRNDVTILDLHGRLVLGDSTKLLRETINDLLDAGKRNFVINLADVPFLDSAGLGRLHASLATARRSGGNIKLLNLTKRIRELMMIVAAETVFGGFFEDEDEAVASFHS